jgi:hypothetical protein
LNKMVTYELGARLNVNVIYIYLNYDVKSDG